MLNKSHRNMLKNKGPRIDPCDTSNGISSQELYADFATQVLAQES